MRRTIFCVVPVLVALFVLPLGAIAAEADKAAEAFDSVYGADLKRVKATPDLKDDLELAIRLFAAAKEATGQPEFLTILCGKALELAIAHPNGYPTAVAAMELLAAGVPGKGVWCAERVVEIRQWQFDAVRTGDRATPGEELITALLGLADLKPGAPAEGAALCRKAEIVARMIKSDRLADIDVRQKALASALKTLREADSLKALLEKKPQKDAVKGQWKMQEGGLRVVSNEAAQRIALPVVVAGSYEFDVEFRRTGGSDNIVFIVPVASSEALISLNAFMDTAIFEATHGQGEPKDNRWVKVGKLQNDRKYSARVQVLIRGDDAQVTVSLDGKRVLGWTGPHAALTRPGDWGLPRRQGLGMGTWCSNVTFSAARLKMLSGKAKLLGPNRQPAKTGPGSEPGGRRAAEAGG